jgi:hypothetical protein
VVYAISVFTHLDEELQHWWMTELGRLLSPGGCLLITVKGSERREEMDLEQQRRFDEGKLVVVEPQSTGSNYCCVYHPDQYVRNRLAGDLYVLDHQPSGAKDTRQDFYLLQKPD